MDKKRQFSNIFRLLVILPLVAFVLQPVTAISASSYMTVSTSVADTLAADTVAHRTDSVAPSKKDAAKKEEKKEFLDSPVHYESSDSMVWVMGGNANI